jgi:hypothetical protein
MLPSFTSLFTELIFFAIDFFVVVYMHEIQSSFNTLLSCLRIVSKVTPFND